MLSETVVSTTPVRDLYPDGKCPVCQCSIPYFALEGHDCAGCGHILTKDDPACYPTASELSKAGLPQADRLPNPVDNADDFVDLMANQENVNPGVLGGKKEGAAFAGDFVLQNQTTGKDEGFAHVSKTWLDQCITFDEGIGRMQEAQRVIHDLLSPLSEWTTSIEGKDVVFVYKGTGRSYRPTPKALKDLTTLGGGSTWATNALAGNSDEEDSDIVRDEGDALCLKTYLDHHLFRGDRMDQAKPRMFRTWEDGTLRAVMSEKYAVLNNVDVLRIFQKLVPGGMLSHWKSNADEIWGNILINDTTRAEKDSAYGGGLSIGNSEIGTRTVYSLPMVFRAICMNGCIWDKEQGEAYRKRHYGEIDLAAVEEGIARNLQRQIPLLKNGIDVMMETRSFLMTGASALQVLAEVCATHKLTKKQAVAIHRAYQVEEGILQETARSAFGVIQAVTRAGQTFERNDLWVKFDEIGGALMTGGADKWGSIVSRAAKLSDKQIEAAGLSLGVA